MLSLWHLHAYTALASLARTWPTLRTEAGRVQVAASDGLRSPLYGRISTGGHGDGGMLHAVEAGVDEQHRWQQLLARVAEQAVHAYWIARSAAPDTRGGPLASIARALPDCTPTAARDIAHHLADADHTARRALDLPPDRQPLVGVPCPVCDTRMLEVCGPGPNPVAWTVICGAGCRCQGPRCPCPSTGSAPAVDAVHIWRWTVIAGRLVAEQEAARKAEQQRAKMEREAAAYAAALEGAT